MRTLIKISRNYLIFWIILIIGTILRISVMFNAYHGDLNNNISWGKLAYERGLNDFYGSSSAEDWPYSAPNQPPLTILTFAMTRSLYVGIGNLFSNLNNTIGLFPSKLIWFWEEKGMILLIKLPSILADLAIGLVIYGYLKRLSNKFNGLIGFAVWILNPISWYNSSIWGQTDSIVNLLGFLSILFLLKKKLPLSALFITLSVLFKGSLMVFIPMIFFVAIKQRYPISEWLKSGLIAFIAIFVTCIWFHPNWDVFLWIINLYKTRILPGEIGYLTAGAFNLWWLVNPGKIPDSQMLYGLNMRLIGMAITLFSGAIVIIEMLRSKFQAKLFWLSLILLSMSAFLFMTRMHGRYLYPAFIPLTIYSVLNKKSFIFLIILSLTFFLNMYWGFWYPGNTLLEEALKSGRLAGILSLVNLVLYFLFFQKYLTSDDK